MPNRIIREGWIESEPIDSLTPQAERFFLRLCLKADDFGRYHASEQLLKSNLFPLKECVRNADISRYLAECERAGLVRCYNDSAKRFLVIPKFDQRSRSISSKFPNPDGCMTVTCQTDDGHMSDTRQSSAHVVVVGDVVDVGSKSDPAGFKEFWDSYPKRVGKIKALEAWLRLQPSQELQETILTALAEQKKSQQWLDQGGKFIPNPTTWLNQKRWEDELRPAVAASRGPNI